MIQFIWGGGVVEAIVDTAICEYYFSLISQLS